MDDEKYSSKLFDSFNFIYKIKGNVYYLLFVFETILLLNIFIAIGNFNYFKIISSWTLLLSFFNPLHSISIIAFLGFYFILEKIYQFFLIYFIYIDRTYEKIKDTINNNLRERVNEFNKNNYNIFKKNTNFFIFTFFYITDLFCGKESLLNYFNFYINKKFPHLNIIDSIAFILIFVVIASLYLARKEFYHKYLPTNNYKIGLKVIIRDLLIFLKDVCTTLFISFLIVAFISFIILCFYYLNKFLLILVLIKNYV